MLLLNTLPQVSLVMSCRQNSRQSACRDFGCAAGQGMEAQADDAAACLISLISLCDIQARQQAACKEAKSAAGQVLEVTAATATAHVL